MKRGIFEKFNNKGQVTIFVIIAIVIAAGVIIYFLLGGMFTKEIPKEMQPVYDYYLGCIEEQARQGAALLGEQGGRIDVGEFVPGSQYMPFSSELDFLGQPVSYWFYVSGNNILMEQVPTKSSMEKELEEYIAARLDYCDFTEFELQGYDIFLGDGEVDVKINDLDVLVDVKNPINIYFGDDSFLIKNHKVPVDSKLGKFYSLALDFYNYEKDNMFLEKYAVDVMRLYAPVTGVEVTCAPKVFIEENIREELKNGLSANVAMLKLNGNYYSLPNEENDFFVTDIGRNIDENVNFIYSQNWPTKIEIYGDKVAKPVGLQEGLGILGFCYVPYHLVYDINFPVLVQFYDNQEIFQFPIAVIIDKSQPRGALLGAAEESIEPEVCKYKNQEVSVATYDADLNFVDSDIEFKCLNDECRIGKTENGVFDGLFPGCVNGFIVASAEDYADTKYQISTNEEHIANIIMRKKYDIPININTKHSALISFVSEDYSTTVLYPDFESVELIEGHYNVSVYVYEESTLKFPETTNRRCVNVPESGIGGMFGVEKEECFDITLPAQEVDYAVIGGGKTSDYFTENMLKEAKSVKINAEIFGTPKSLEDVQQNYLEADSSLLGISLI